MLSMAAIRGRASRQRRRKAGSTGEAAGEWDKTTPHRALRQALDAEEYERAARIRDELGRERVRVELSVSAANSAFYSAFSSRSVDAMENVLSRSDDVRVVHPGMSEVTGQSDVRASWRSMLRHSIHTNARITPERVCISVRDGKLAIVTCEEVAETDSGTGRLAATNIFEHDDELGKWLLLQHHASNITG